MTAVKNIPTVDLNDYTSGGGASRSRLIETLGDGLQEFGFLNVEGHGIDSSLIRGTYDLWKRFFELPDAVKRKYAGVEGGARGYTPFGVEHAKDNPLPDLKEFWHVGQEPPAGHPFRTEYPANVWPAEIPEIQEPTLRLYSSLERVAENLLRALAEYFEMPRDSFSSMMDVGNSILRILHYPPVKPEYAPAVRAAAHEDINLITLLCEATDSGLEILTREGEWMAVETGPGQIVVDAGDMLSRFTNEVIPATTHRVVNPAENAARDRFSMPFFVHPYSSCDLTIPERFTGPDHPPKYPPITAGQFLEQRLREIGLKK
ncbi:MAG TPA: 2-oxoglutarate and iron-dependent oxygenase domain-containing protein [Thermoanaerobaculia bacterium]|nr:2-oxoglutarate and iron-dependent oxygenase domain-containing protein [Thermoanaerobaculia bacterium]